MFKGINTITNELYPIPIPILRFPPNGSTALIEEYRDFKFNRVEAIISTYTQNSKYLELINWNEVFISKFPNNISFIPSLLINTNGMMQICINQDLATSKFDRNTNKIVINDPVDFAACSLYAINKMLLLDMEDNDICHIFFKSVTIYFYTMILRLYQRDIDILSISDQRLAKLFFVVSKMVATMYFNYTGDLNSLLKTTVMDFFVKKSETKPTKLRINMNDIDNERDITSITELLENIHDLRIIPNITLQDFRSRIIQSYGMTMVMCLSSGIEFLSMLGSCKIASQVFTSRSSGISPFAINSIMKAIIRYMNSLNVESKPFFLDKDW